MAEIVEHQRQMGESAHLPNLTLSNYIGWLRVYEARRQGTSVDLVLLQGFP